MPARIAFHLGFHKTATTWFQREAMPRHPDIVGYLTGPARLDPLIQDLVFASDREFDVPTARAHVDERIAELAPREDQVVLLSEERLSGHAITGGFDTVRIAQRIAAVVPEARVFFLVREQLDMIESEYLQLVQEGTVAPLRSLLAFQPQFATVPGFDLGHYEYDRLADEYATGLGRTQVSVFEFREMTRDPQGFLHAVADFLDIPPWPTLPDDVLQRRVNPTLPRRLLGFRRLLNHFERRPLNPYPLLALPPFWRGPMWWLASRLPRRRRPIIDAATRSSLTARYEGSNGRLAERFGVRFPA